MFKKLSLLILLLLLFPAYVLGQENIQPSQNLPEKYDLRNLNGKNYVTPVKNQSSFGTCWAHAGVSVSETSAILKGAPSSIDLSEKALAWYNFNLQNSQGVEQDLREGLINIGYDSSWYYDQISLTYASGSRFSSIYSQLATWYGTSTEEEISYCNSKKEYRYNGNSVVPSMFGDWTLPYSKINQNAYHLKEAFSYDRDHILEVDPIPFTNRVKQQMLNYGAAYLQYIASTDYPDYNSETFAQYIFDIPAGLGHSVTIVGWDDTFSASNFTLKPPGDGAWIVKNSWGPEFGDQGYFYLSYYDNSISKAGFLDVEAF